MAISEQPRTLSYCCEFLHFSFQMLTYTASGTGGLESAKVMARGHRGSFAVTPSIPRYGAEFSSNSLTHLSNDDTALGSDSTLKGTGL